MHWYWYFVPDENEPSSDTKQESPCRDTDTLSQMKMNHRVILNKNHSVMSDADTRSQDNPGTMTKDFNWWLILIINKDRRIRIALRVISEQAHEIKPLSDTN